MGLSQFSLSQSRSADQSCSPNENTWPKSPIGPMPESSDSGAILEQFAQAKSSLNRLVTSRARELVNHGPWFQEHEIDDIAQEFRATLLAASPNFDPAISKLSTFASTIIKRKKASLIRQRSAIKRGTNVTRRLSELPKHSNSSINVLEQLNSHDDGPNSSSDPAHRMSNEDMSNAIKRSLSALDDRDRRIAESLMKNSKNATAKHFGITRRSLEKCLSRIAVELNRCGCRDFLV